MIVADSPICAQFRILIPHVRPRPTSAHERHNNYISILYLFLLLVLYKFYILLVFTFLISANMLCPRCDR